MTFHRSERATNHMPTYAYSKKFTVRLNQRGNSPERYDCKRHENAARKFESRVELNISMEKLYRSNGQKWNPPDRPFGQKCERQREIKCPPEECLMFDVRCLIWRKPVAQQFVPAPMRKSDKQHQRHVRDGGFRMPESLERECEYDRCPPTDAISSDARAPGEDRQCGERGSDGRWKTCREIVFPKDFVARDLRPVGEGRFVEAEVIVEIRNDVIAALNHFARRFGEARLVPIDERKTPCAGDVKEHAAKKQEGGIADCGFQA